MDDNGGTLALPGGGELVMLGIGKPICAHKTEGAEVDLVSLSRRAVEWECARDVRAVDVNGAAVAGAEVWMATQRDGNLRSAMVGWTEADGWARSLPAPCGEAVAGVMRGGNGVWGLPSEEEAVTVALPEATARLHGRVRSGDQRVEGAQVELQWGAWLERSQQPGGPMSSVTVWTDAEGRWSADLNLPEDNREVRQAVFAEGFMSEFDRLPLRRGQERAKFDDLTPARRVHLRCVGGPEDSCQREGGRLPVCGPPSELRPGLVRYSGEAGRTQVSVICPDVPDLQVTLAGEQGLVYEDVAWFSAP